MCLEVGVDQNIHGGLAAVALGSTFTELSDQ